MNSRSADLAAYALLIGAVIAGVLLWDQLPDRIAVHFGTGGTPDNYLAKPLAVVLAPTVGVAGVIVTRYAPDSLRRGYAASRVEDLAVVFLGGVVAYAQGFIYAWNLGYRLNPVVVSGPVLVAALVLVAYSYTRGGAPG